MPERRGHLAAGYGDAGEQGAAERDPAVPRIYGDAVQRVADTGHMRLLIQMPTVILSRLSFVDRGHGSACG